MNIVLVIDSVLPVKEYGGTQRVVWSLAAALARRGYKVSLLAQAGTECSFAKVIPWNKEVALALQIPKETDVVHFSGEPEGWDKVEQPYLTTIHGNRDSDKPLPLNSVFVSRNHAARHGSMAYVHNGLDWNEYPQADLTKPRSNYAFLGKATWRVKNAKGAVEVLSRLPEDEKLHVLGGSRLQLKMGLSALFDKRIEFHGMVNDAEKARVLMERKALINPVRWNEPFGLAIIEALYYGCPVFATPYGAIPELLNSDVGFMSNRAEDIAEALFKLDTFDRKACHQWAVDRFSANRMASDYINLYERVIAGEKLNKVQPVLQYKPGDMLPWHG